MAGCADLPVSDGINKITEPVLAVVSPGLHLRSL